MDRILGRYSEPIYAILRIVVGLFFACHGAQKVFGAFGGPGGNGQALPLTSFFGVGGLIELITGLLILVGLFASWAAFIASGEMAVAYFMAHFPQGFWPIVNKGELAAVYAFLFLYIAARGSGIWSLDQALGRGRGGTRTDARIPAAGR
jgi:putative oxidoreductase